MRTGWDRGRGKGHSLVALIAAFACAIVILATPAAGQATKQKPAATEIGVTPTEIHIAVIADVDNPIAPNLAIGPRDAVKGFASYINASCATKNNCLAGRKLVVDFYDSQANPSETRNAEILACANDLAMVGTSAVFLNTVDDMRSCKDQAGLTTGIPDIPFITAAVVHECSDESFPIVPPVLECATKDQHPQTYQANVARGYFCAPRSRSYGPVRRSSLRAMTYFGRAQCRCVCRAASYVANPPTNRGLPKNAAILPPDVCRDASCRAR